MVAEGPGDVGLEGPVPAHGPFGAQGVLIGIGGVEAGSGGKTENQLLWKQRMRRLEAETLRDAFLSVAGTLNPQMFGPPVPMQRQADATGVFLHGFRNTKPGFGHWNQAGHALAASLIARHLCPR